MLKRTLAVLASTSLLAAAGAFAGTLTTPPCCHKAERAAEQPAQKLRCSLTGKTVDRCCCVERQGKLHCTLADKDVQKCCCKPAEDKKASCLRAFMSTLIRSASAQPLRVTTLGAAASLREVWSVNGGEKPQKSDG